MANTEEMLREMNKKATANNRKKYPIQIILVGVPKVVMHVIHTFQRLDWAKAGDWLKVKRNNATGEVTMTITIDFML